MPTFLPQYESDIYVSYARADDEAYLADEPDSTWVRDVADILNSLLGQTLGSKNWGTMRIDAGLTDDDVITAEAEHLISKSAVLLVILSEAYLRCQPCRKQLDIFIRSAGGADPAAERVFVILPGNIDRDRWPEGLQGQLGYQLVPNTANNGRSVSLGPLRPDLTELRNATRLDDLGTDLGNRLQRLANQADTSAQGANAVFLAEVVDELSGVRDSVKRYLIQDGLRVLPEIWYRRSVEEFRKATSKDLSKCGLFVQLLGDHPDKTDQMPTGYSSLQLELAVEAGLATMRWRSPELDLQSIEIADFRNMLQRENIVAVGLEEFKRSVAKRANAIASQRRSSSAGACVLVNADPIDRPLAEQVALVLERNGLNYNIPQQDDVPLEHFQNDQYPLDGLLIVYGACPAMWVHQQLWRYRKAMARSKWTPPICAVYEGPPATKDPVRFRLPRVDFIDCRSEMDESRLYPFIQAIHGRNS